VNHGGCGTSKGVYRLQKWPWTDNAPKNAFLWRRVQTMMYDKLIRVYKNTLACKGLHKYTCMVYLNVRINWIEIWQTKFSGKVLTTMSNNLIHTPTSPISLVLTVNGVSLDFSLPSAVLQSNLWFQLLTVAIVLHTSTLVSARGAKSPT